MEKNLILENFNHDEKYLIGFSGGPDSVALLDYLVSYGFKNIIICYVDYHDQIDSDKERLVVMANIKKYKLESYVLDKELSDVVGNFEDWARQVRYDFFRHIGKEVGSSRVFIAHQEDDNLETYLLQKRRKNNVAHYGLQEVIVLSDLTVIRPLLNFSREEILLYLKRGNLLCHFDQTNNNLAKMRNKLRHQYLSDLSREEKNELLAEMKEKNALLQNSYAVINKILATKQIELAEYLQLTIQERERFIYAFLEKHFLTTTHKTRIKKISDIKNMLESKRVNAVIYLFDNMYLYKEYGVFYLSHFKEIHEYSYIVAAPIILQTKELVIDFINDGAKMGINLSHYPLVVRNVRTGDKIKFGKIHKDIRKILITAKVPFFERKKTTVIEDKFSEIIYFSLDNKYVKK